MTALPAIAPARSDSDREFRLRRLFVLDGLIAVPIALAYLLASPLVSALVGVTAERVVWAGIVLSGFALLSLLTARCRPLARWAAIAVIAVNTGWVLATAITVVAEANELTGLGWGYLIAQSLFATSFAILEARALILLTRSDTE